jgi:hypothetical protein
VNVFLAKKPKSTLTSPLLLSPFTFLPIVFHTFTLT